MLVVADRRMPPVLRRQWDKRSREYTTASGFLGEHSAKGGRKK